MLIEISRLRVAAGVATVLALSACGGGGDQGGTLAPTPTVPVAAGITSSNYLDAFWVGALGVQRAVVAGTVLDSAFGLVIALNDVPGTLSCPYGGNASLVKSGNQRFVTVNNCNDGNFVFVSGTISTADAVTQNIAGTVYLKTGNFKLDNVVYRYSGAQLNDTELLAGTIAYSLSADGRSATAKGELSASYNGRVDRYTNVSLTAITNAQGEADISIGSMRVDSMRFPIPLLVTGSSDQLAMSAVSPDTSLVRGIYIAGATVDSFRYEVLAAPGAVPSVTQTYTVSDPLVQAAIIRARQ